MLSSQGCRRNSVWRRAASHRDGGDDVGSSTSGCSREAGGLLCRTGMTEKGASLFDFETISLSNHDVCCVCSMAFFLCDTRLRKWRILHLRWLKEKKKEWSISVTRVRLWKKKKRFECDIYKNLPHGVSASAMSFTYVAIFFTFYCWVVGLTTLTADNTLKKIATYVKDMASHWRHATYVYKMSSC